MTIAGKFWITYFLLVACLIGTAFAQLTPLVQQRIDRDKYQISLNQNKINDLQADSSNLQADLQNATTDLSEAQTADAQANVIPSQPNDLVI